LLQQTRVSLSYDYKYISNILNDFFNEDTVSLMKALNSMQMHPLRGHGDDNFIVKK